MTRARGIDVSKYDLTFDPTKATEPIDFVVQRASYRTTRDEGFDEIYEGVKQVPLRLAYHYLNSDTDWKKQYDLFMSVVDGKGFQGYVCDFESSFNVMSSAFAKMAWDFIRQCVIDTGKRVMLYTNYYHYKDYLTPSEPVYGIKWDRADLWIAQYPNTPDPENGQPQLPPARTTGWNMWQYSSKGNGWTHGVGRPLVCDLDVFNGDVAMLKSYLQVPDTTPEPVVYPTASLSLTVGGVTYTADNVVMKPKA